MNFLVRHISDILADYKAEVPLSVYLRNYFRSFPKLGSRDRKAISQAVYLYYRYSKRLPGDLTVFEIIFNAIQYSRSGGSFLETMLLRYDDSLPLKTAAIILPEEQLPELSGGIALQDWYDSFLTQPRMFIRTRKPAVAERLQIAGIPYSHCPAGDSAPLSPACLALPNGTDLENLLPPEDYVVQDWASQQSVHFLLENCDLKPGKKVWDCCAGAGGKSLMVTDLAPGAEILATDIRASILSNLTARFRRYRLPVPKTALADVSDPAALQMAIPGALFDLIISDAPCSGSGTWERTPEQYHFFRRESLKAMYERQLKIASNIAPFLKPGGTLAYITCSVFKEENEAVVREIAAGRDLEITATKLIDGTKSGADSMFIALLKKLPDRPVQIPATSGHS